MKIRLFTSILLYALPVLIIAFTLSGCSSSKQVVSIKPNEHIEIGWTPRTIFQSPAYAWFDTAYTAYQPNQEKLEQLSKMKDSVDILVVYGTWCSDSRRELPHFFKIMDAIKFPADKISLIALDRSKQLPPGIAQQHDITLVPTFIITYRGMEIGRIIESPKTSLEEDLPSMLKPMFQ
ncbi:MAG: thioredoxin family protein [Bacteroidota bacterium]